MKQQASNVMISIYKDLHGIIMMVPIQHKFWQPEMGFICQRWFRKWSVISEDKLQGILPLLTKKSTNSRLQIFRITVFVVVGQISFHTVGILSLNNANSLS